MADLDIYDLIEDAWIQPNFISKNFLSQRTNHIAELIGHHMIIHGGINDDNKVLGDVHLLSLSPFKWSPANLNDQTPSPSLYGHACALVIPSELRFNPRMNIYKFPEISFGKMTTHNKVFF